MIRVLCIVTLLAVAALANATTYSRIPSTARLKAGVSLERSCGQYYVPDENSPALLRATGALALVLPDGSVGEVQVTESSGSASLDLAFANCLTTLGPIYDAVGPRASWHQVHLNWPAIAKSKRTAAPGAFFNLH